MGNRIPDFRPDSVRVGEVWETPGSVNKDREDRNTRPFELPSYLSRSTVTVCGPGHGKRVLTVPRPSSLLCGKRVDDLCPGPPRPSPFVHTVQVGHGVSVTQDLPPESWNPEDGHARNPVGEGVLSGVRGYTRPLSSSGWDRGTNLFDSESPPLTQPTNDRENLPRPNLGLLSHLRTHTQ